MEVLVTRGSVLSSLHVMGDDVETATDSSNFSSSSWMRNESSVIIVRVLKDSALSDSCTGTSARMFGCARCGEMGRQGNGCSCDTIRLGSTVVVIPEQASDAKQAIIYTSNFSSEKGSTASYTNYSSADFVLCRHQYRFQNSWQHNLQWIPSYDVLAHASLSARGMVDSIHGNTGRCAAWRTQFHVDHDCIPVSGIMGTMKVIWSHD